LLIADKKASMRNNLKQKANDAESGVGYGPSIGVEDVLNTNELTSGGVEGNQTSNGYCGALRNDLGTSQLVLVELTRSSQL